MPLLVSLIYQTYWFDYRKAYIFGNLIYAWNFFKAFWTFSPSTVVMDRGGESRTTYMWSSHNGKVVTVYNNGLHITNQFIPPIDTEDMSPREEERSHINVIVVHDILQPGSGQSAPTVRRQSIGLPRVIGAGGEFRRSPHHPIRWGLASPLLRLRCQRRCRYMRIYKGLCCKCR